MLKSSIENRGSTDIKAISAAGSGQEETERKWVKPQNIENNNSSRTAEIPPSGSYTIIQFDMIQALSSRGLSNISCYETHHAKFNMQQNNTKNSQRFNNMDLRTFVQISEEGENYKYKYLYIA